MVHLIKRFPKLERGAKTVDQKQKRIFERAKAAS
jgi:hypothetical protein